MATMNISLPEEMKQFIEDRVAEEGYSTTSEYFRQLVREDKKRKAEERLEALLLESINSGEPLPYTKEVIQEVRQKLHARLLEGKK